MSTYPEFEVALWFCQPKKGLVAAHVMMYVAALYKLLAGSIIFESVKIS